MFIASIAVMFDMYDNGEPAVFHGLSYQPHTSANRALSSACSHAAFNIFQHYFGHACIDELENSSLSAFAYEVTGSIVPLDPETLSLKHSEATPVVTTARDTAALRLVEQALDAQQSDAINGHYGAVAARRAG